MKLYSSPLSSNARRVLVTAAYLGIELEQKIIDFAKGEHQAPEYLALNPNGMVPTLTDGDFVLSESRAIVQYLAMKKPESGLYPSDPKVRADVTRWQFWDAVHLAPAVSTVFFERMLKPMFGLGEPDAAFINDGLERFKRFSRVLDGHLAGKRFVVGDALTLADITIAASLMYAEPADLPLGDYANVSAWRASIQDLEAWKQTAPPSP